MQLYLLSPTLHFLSLVFSVALNSTDTTCDSILRSTNVNIHIVSQLVLAYSLCLVLS